MAILYVFHFGKSIKSDKLDYNWKDLKILKTIKMNIATCQQLLLRYGNITTSPGLPFLLT